MACASSYEPARSPRVTLVRNGIGAEFVRDGQYYSHGLFGGGLRKAVEGVPKAEEHARAYQTANAAGFFSVLAGGVAIGIGVGGIPGAGESDAVSDALIVGGAALELLGVILYAKAPAELWDAINVHNDEVQRKAVEQWRRDRANRAQHARPAAPAPAPQPSPR